MKKFSLLRSLVYGGLTVSFGAGLNGCGVKGDLQTSKVKVTNGVEVSPGAYPEVVELAMLFEDGSARCTGTFVNATQVLTAAHCVAEVDFENPEVYVVVDAQDDNGLPQKRALGKAISVAVHPDYPNDQSIRPSDLAVVDFEEGVSLAQAELRSKPAKKGEKLTIVGYGHNLTYMDYFGLNGEGGGLKRDGTNVVDDVADGFITFIGTPQAAEGIEPGTKALAGSGDSGGPLFIDGKLAGVTSGGGLYWAGSGYDGLSYYVDINSESSRSFLETVLKTK